MIDHPPGRAVIHPFVVRPTQHSPLRVVGETISVIARSETTGGYEVFLQQGPEGAGPPPHTHPWDEGYYVLDGQIDVLMGSDVVTIGSGEFAFIPRDTLHNFRIRTAQAKFLSFNSGSGASKFFEELDREVGGSLNVPEIVRVALRHQVEIPPPSP